MPGTSETQRLGGSAMYCGPDATVVAGVRSRYSCRDVVEVDRHLRWLVGRLERTLPALSAARQAHVRGQFAVDFNALLDARIMLAALATLEDDFSELFRGWTPQGPEVVSRAL
jgi:hypothetical protein